MMVRASLLLALAISPVAAQGVAYEGSLSVATGDYFFTEPTTSWMLVSGLAVTAGRVTVRASVPLYVQNTTLVTRSGNGWVPSGGPMAGTVSDSGGRGSRRGRVPVSGSVVTGFQSVLGDPMAQASFGLVQRVRTSVTVGASVKLPVADTSEFGTGQWDVGAGIGGTQWVGQSFVALDVSYWHIGDLPDLALHDPVMGTVTVGRHVGNAWVASAALYGATAPMEGYAMPVSIGATLGHVGGLLWTASLALGLSETAADFTFGLSWRASL